MMRTELGVDVGSGASWSAEFGCNRDGECFLVVFVRDAHGHRLAVSTTYDHQQFPEDDAELKRWAALAVQTSVARWTAG